MTNNYIINTDRINPTIDDATDITRVTSIAGTTLSQERVTSAGTVFWQVEFSEEVVDVGRDDFRITVGNTGGVQPTNVQAVSGDTSKWIVSHTVSARTTDTDIHLLLVASPTIFDSLANAGNRNQFTVPSFATTNSNRLTTDNSRYILNTDDTGASITARTNITRVENTGSNARAQRVTTTGDIRWRVEFDQSVYGVGTDDFRIVVGNNGGVAPSIVDFTAGANFAIVRYNVATTSNTDMEIHLDLATNVTITDSTSSNGNQNQFVTPTFNTPSRLTDTNSRYILNTDTARPTISARTNITRVQANGTSAADQRVTNTGTIRWRVQFSEEVVGVDENDFRVVVGSTGAVVPTGIQFTDDNNFAIISHNVQTSPTTDTNIHLDLASSVSITDSTATTGNQNSFAIPTSFATNRRLTDDTNSYILNTDTTGPSITARTNITRVSDDTNTAVADQRVTSTGDIRWRVEFNQNVYGVGNDDFLVVVDNNNGVAPSNVQFTQGDNFAVIRYNVNAASDSDMEIHLDLANSVTITDSTSSNGNENDFIVPNFITNRRLTVTNANSYILNTDTSNPTINGRANITRVQDTTSNTARAQRVTTTGNIRWRVQFSEEVVGVDRNDFLVVVGGCWWCCTY